MIRLDDTIKLLKIEIRVDKELNQVEEYVEKEVFCKINSVVRSEFYSAATTGLRPNMTIIINEFEYDDEEKINYKGELYTILRIFKKDEYLEMIVGEKVGEND